MKKRIFNLSLLLFLIFLVSGCGNKTLKSFTISVDDLIPVNETRKIKVSYNPSDVKEEIIWSSSNEEIAEVKNGLISAKNPGTVTIVAETTLSKGGKFNIG